MEDDSVEVVDNYELTDDDSDDDDIDYRSVRSSDLSDDDDDEDFNTAQRSLDAWVQTCNGIVCAICVTFFYRIFLKSMLPYCPTIKSLK